MKSPDTACRVLERIRGERIVPKLFVERVKEAALLGFPPILVMPTSVKPTVQHLSNIRPAPRATGQDASQGISGDETDNEFFHVHVFSGAFTSSGEQPPRTKMHVRVGSS